MVVMGQAVTLEVGLCWHSPCWPAVEGPGALNSAAGHAPNFCSYEWIGWSGFADRICPQAVFAPALERLKDPHEVFNCRLYNNLYQSGLILQSQG